MLLNFKDLTEDGDSEAVIKTKAFEKGVLALPGTVFLPNGTKTAYVRASFSLTEEKDVDKEIERCNIGCTNGFGVADHRFSDAFDKRFGPEYCGIVKERQVQ